MSTDQQVDYSVVLADMEAKRAALDAAIVSMRKFLNGQAGGASTSDSTIPGSASFSSGEIPTGAFHGKSIPEAATLYLQIMKRKSTTREIADGLRKGGMESTSSNFPSIVHAVLDRYRKAGGEVVKLDKALWGLAAWYPAGVRAATVSHEKRATSKKPKRAKRKTQATVTPKKIVVEEHAAPIAESTFKSGGTPYQRIVAFLTAYPFGPHSVEAVAHSVGLEAPVAKKLLGNAVQNHKAEKMPGGEYRGFSAKPQEMSLA